MESLMKGDSRNYLNIGDFKRYSDVDDVTLTKQLQELSEWRLKLIRKAAGKVISNKYQRSKEAKYANLPRCLNINQLKCFFSYCNRRDTRFYFALMFFFALRIGEVNRVEYLAGQKLLLVNSLKSGPKTYLPVPDFLHDWLLDHMDLIQNNISIPYLEKLFRKIRSRASELCYVYAKATNGRPLYQFTSHSFRHTAINLMGCHLRDPYKICQYSRHSASGEVGVMATYRYYDLEDMRVDLSCVMKSFSHIVYK